MRVADSLPSKLLPALGRAVALFVEAPGDDSGGQTLRRQIADALAELWIVAELLQLGHWADHDALCRGAAGPANAHPDPLADALDLDHDPLYHLADDPLAIPVRGGRGLPQCGAHVPHPLSDE
jgi:hypothetical protein